MLDWAENLKSIIPRDRAREVREDAVKLWAWGEEVAINGATLITKNEKYRDAMSGGREGEIQYLLTELERICRNILVDSQDSSAGDLTRVPSHQQPYRKRRDEIHKCIRALRRALPESYRERIFVRKDGFLRTVGAGSLSLPEMSDESLQPTTEDASPVVGTSTIVSPLTRTTSYFLTDRVHNGRLDGQDVDQENRTVSRMVAGSTLGERQSTSLESHPRDSDGTTPYSPIPDEGFGEYDADTTPASTPVSNRTTPGFQPSVTSPGSSNSVSAGDHYIVRRKDVPPSTSTFALPSPRLSMEPSRSHGAVLTGSGIQADM